jgi:hypothetical protein
MYQLLSKLQYKNFEPGEFTALEERSLDEINQLIKAFPWEEQRHFTPVGPTCPSITIEDITGNYLKFGHHYYEKYCLYLLTAEGKLLKKVVQNLEEGIKIVTGFYSGDVITDGFEHEFALHAWRHFTDKDFKSVIAYQGTLFSIGLFTLAPLLFLAMSLFMILAGNKENTNKDVPLVSIEILCLTVDAFLFFLAIMAWRMFLNHYRIAKNEFIVISKGHNEFVFGTEADNKTYLKDKIVSFKEFRNTQRNNPWGGLYFTDITFSDGEQIKISSLIMKNGYAKFPDVKCEMVSKFLPFMK